MQKIVTIGGGILVAYVGGLVIGMIVFFMWNGFEVPNPAAAPSVILFGAIQAGVGYALANAFSDWRRDEKSLEVVCWVMAAIALFDLIGTYVAKSNNLAGVTWWDVGERFAFFVVWTCFLIYTTILNKDKSRVL